MPLLECDKCWSCDIDGHCRYWSKPISELGGICPRFVPVPSVAAEAAPSRFEQIGVEVGRLVAEKQTAYGDSFGKSGDVMRILYPNGIPPEKLDDALTVVRVLDKLFRIATDRDALGESPWKDVLGYAMLSVARAEKDLKEALS